MTNQKVILMITFILMIIPFATATESFIFQQNKATTLELPVFENDMTKCTTCTCDISISYPNGSNVVRSASTDISGHYAIYNLTTALTSVSGIYAVDVHCSNGADSGAATFEYEVTPTGHDASSVWDNPILLILGLLGFFLVVLGAYLEAPWFGFIGAILFLLTGIYTMIYGINGMTDLYTRGLAGVLVGLGLIFIVLSAYEGMESEN